MLHGTPGCRLNRHPDNAKVAATGARVVTYDRPGYGASDRHHGRTVVDCVADITALVDHLGTRKVRGHRRLGRRPALPGGRPPGCRTG